MILKFTNNQLMMEQKYISVREFLRKFKDLNDSKQTLVVSKNGQPQGVYTPYEQWSQNNHQTFKTTDRPNPKILLTPKLLAKYAIKSNDPHLSQNVDDIYK